MVLSRPFLPPPLNDDDTTASGFAAAGGKRPPDRNSPCAERTNKRPPGPRDFEIEARDSVSTLKQQAGTAVAIHEAHDGSTLTAEAGAGSSGERAAGTRGQSGPATACWRCHREIAILDGQGGQSHHLSGSGAGIAAASWDGGGGGGLGQSSLLTLGSDNDDAAKDGGSDDALDSTYTPRTVLRGHRPHCPLPLSPGADTLLAENSAFGTLATEELDRDLRHLRPANGRTTAAPDDANNPFSAEKPPSQQREEEETLELSFSQLRRHDQDQDERFNGRITAESQGPRGCSGGGGDDDDGCGGSGGGSGPRARRRSALRRRRSRRGDRKRCKTNFLLLRGGGGSLTRGGKRRSRTTKSRGAGAALAGRGAAAGGRHFFSGDEVCVHACRTETPRPFYACVSLPSLGVAAKKWSVPAPYEAFQRSRCPPRHE